MKVNITSTTSVKSDDYDGLVSEPLFFLLYNTIKHYYCYYSQVRLVDDDCGSVDGNSGASTVWMTVMVMVMIVMWFRRRRWTPTQYHGAGHAVRGRLSRECGWTRAFIRPERPPSRYAPPSPTVARSRGPIIITPRRSLAFRPGPDSGPRPTKRPPPPPHSSLLLLLLLNYFKLFCFDRFLRLGIHFTRVDRIIVTRPDGRCAHTFSDPAVTYYVLTRRPDVDGFCVYIFC